MFRSHRLALAALTTLLFCASGHSSAQAQEQPAIALPRFSPNFMGDRFFAVDSPHTPGHPGIYAGLVLDYAHNPLVFRRDLSDGSSEKIGAIVEHHMLLHANATLALWERVSLNVSVPVGLLQDGEAPQLGDASFASPSGVGLGDPRIGLRGRLYGEYEDPFQIALGANVWVPIADSEPGSFLGNGSLRILPQVVLGGIIDRFVYAGEVGVEVRAGQTYGGVQQGTMLQYGAAVGGLLGKKKRFQLGADIYGTLVFDEISKRTSNLEVLLGAKWRFIKPMVLGVAAGPGITGGIGTPDVRAVMSIAYSPEPVKRIDRDGDGIYDDVDACPTVAGVSHQDPARNGCPPPPPDSDGDGILDVHDACPTIKGVPNSDKTKHGCPPPGDTDGDGIIDKFDACPTVKGVSSSVKERHGCPPPPDTDGDGIIDELDACPKVKGVPNDEKAKHGCPPPPDTDGDGILDEKDACPKAKGKRHDDPKKNGCPRVIVKGKEIVILERIEFAVNKSIIKEESFGLLDDIAKIFNENLQIKLVEVQGHTDKRGSRFMNRRLSRRRANSVVAALVKRGVGRNRMRARGYGPDKPIRNEDTEEAYQLNRRVQFVILKQIVKDTVKVDTKAINR